MKVNRKLVAVAGAVAALGGTGAGIAYAVGGDSEEQATGPAAEQAKRAAIKAVGGGTVSEVERQDGDGPAGYEVEVQRDDGSRVELRLDRNFDVVGQGVEDDGQSDEDGPGDD
jgi:uncharacterized membrane protein YkoI